MQEDVTRYRRVLGFGFSACVVTLVGAIVTFAFGLKILGTVLAVLAVFNLINAIVVMVQMRRR